MRTGQPFTCRWEVARQQRACVAWVLHTPGNPQVGNLTIADKSTSYAFGPQEADQRFVMEHMERDATFVALTTTVLCRSLRYRALLHECAFNKATTAYDCMQ